MTGRVSLLVAAALCAALTITYACLESPRHDEGTTIDLAHGPDLPARWPDPPRPIAAHYETLDGHTDYGFSGVIDALLPESRMNHPPGYYLLFHAWTAVLGTHKLTYRLLGCLAGLATLLALARLARRVIPQPGAAGWTVLLMAVAPWFVAIAQYARPYGMALCLCAWAAVAALAVHDPGRTRTLGPRAAFVLLSAAALYTVYHAAFVIAWLGVLLLMMVWLRPRGRRLKELGAVLLMGLGIALLFAPWVPVLRHHLMATSEGHNRDYFRGTVSAGQFGDQALELGRQLGLTEIPSALLPDGDLLDEVLAVLALISLAAAALAFVRRRPRRALDGRARLFWLSAPLYPAGVALADQVHGTHTLFISKLVFFLFPLGVLLVVHAWLSLPRRWPARVGLVAWLALLATGTANNLDWLAGNPTDQVVVARYVARHDEPRHLVVVSSPTRGHFEPLLVALRSQGVEHVHLAHAGGWALSGKPNAGAGLVRAAVEQLGYDRITLVNMQTSYTEKRGGGGSYTWETGRLAAVRRQAEKAGWASAWLGVPGLERQEDLPPRSLTIVSPVRAPR